MFLRFCRSGITLIELLVVLSIITFMTMIVMPKVSSFSEGSYIRSAQGVLQALKSEQKIYYLKNDAFATSFQQLNRTDPSNDVYTYEITVDSSNNPIIKATRLDGEFEDGELMLSISHGDEFIFNDYGRYGDEIDEEA